MRRTIALAFIAAALACTPAMARPTHCPPRLGCGCNLANHFGGIDRFGWNTWRELWRARDWLQHFARARRGCVGCVAVLSRGRRGGHVGVVRHYDSHGNPVIFSYANRRLGWRTATFSARRVLGYVRVGGSRHARASHSEAVASAY